MKEKYTIDEVWMGTNNINDKDSIQLLVRLGKLELRKVGRYDRLAIKIMVPG